MQMRESRGLNSVSSPLPPGCRFYPSEEQLLCYYLPNKNNCHDDSSNFCGYNVIREIDLYNYDPLEFPDVACYAYGCGGRKRHWYCYTLVSVVKERSKGGNRRAKGGFWRRGRVRDVLGGRGCDVVRGTRTKFVFYMGNSAKSMARTDWVMYEYALLDHQEASFLLCRAFVKAHSRNSISEHGLSSCAEESASVVRHIGIRCNGISLSGTVKAEDNSVRRNSEPSRSAEGPIERLDDQVMAGQDPVASLDFQSDNQPREPVRLAGISGTDDMPLVGASAQDILSIVEEDFIELNDLTVPLLGTDSFP